MLLSYWPLHNHAVSLLDGSDASPTGSFGYPSHLLDPFPSRANMLDAPYEVGCFAGRSRCHLSPTLAGVPRFDGVAPRSDLRLDAFRSVSGLHERRSLRLGSDDQNRGSLT